MATDILVLSDLTADPTQFIQQFQTSLTNKPTWVGNLTTQTSQTMIEMISAVGGFAQGRIIREAEDVFSETAQSDSAIRSITQMQGLRMSRYLPAGMTCVLTSTTTVSIPPLTQFSCAGTSFFNRDQLSFVAGVPLQLTLYEGSVAAYTMSGLGTERQTFVSQEDAFVISDLDTMVTVNQQIIPKAYGGLWNFDGLPGYSDITMSDGRLLLQFGNLGGTNGQFGTIPLTNDQVVISYAITSGESGNSIVTVDKSVTVTGQPQITGLSTANPKGGANDKPVIAYKNIAAGGFGTYNSAVTKSQYQAIIGTYPGIVDAVTQAQREIDPSNYRWMNVIRVAGLTASSWTQAQKKQFTDYCQTVTMYSTYFLWQDPTPIPRTVALDVYIFNSAIPDQVKQNSITAITKLFTPRPGLLMTNFYVSDLEWLIKQANPGQVSYVIPRLPSGPMIVTAPESPVPTFTLNPTGGNLGTYSYAYAVSTTLTTGETGTPVNWVFPQIVATGPSTYSITLTWNPVIDAQTYHVWGRDPINLGKLADVAAVPNAIQTFTDSGSITPVPPVPPAVSDFPIRYNSLASLTINVYYAERQQRFDDNPTRLIGS